MKNKIYTRIQARKHLPKRLETDNKTKGGKCLIIAGAPGQWGASVLCARAAARCGAGYTFIFDFKKSLPTLKFPDFLVRSHVKDFFLFDAFAIGPGLRDQVAILKFIRQLIKLKKGRVVLDAEALNALARIKKPFRLPSSWILTPHEGEMARLLNTSSQVVKADRSGAAIKLQKKMGCIVLLKGSPTFITDGTSFYQIKAGNSALAKAGTGDVLTGVIAGLLSQKVDPLQAACLAAFLHGSLADKWVQDRKDHLSLMASDLIEQIPSALFRMRNRG